MIKQLYQKSVSPLIALLFLVGVGPLATAYGAPVQQIHVYDAKPQPVASTKAGGVDFGFLQNTPGISKAYHYITQLFYNDKVVELEDGSRWLVSDIDAVNGWLAVPTEQLVLTQNHAFFSTYRFALVNLALNKAVPVSLCREPNPKVDSVKFIVSADHSNNVIVLNDDSLWVVYESDKGTINRFNDHDRVVVGLNSSDFANSDQLFHYILIDTAANNYVRASEAPAPGEGLVEIPVHSESVILSYPNR